MAKGDVTVKLIRKAARELSELIDEYPMDEAMLRKGIPAALKELVKRPDLLDYGVARQDSHTGGSKILYYDPDVRITINRFPPSVAIGAHDHATWESMVVYQGQFRHTCYERIDDRSKEGYAKLKVTEDKVLQPGEFAMIIPPNDLHSFVGLTEDTWAVFVASGQPALERCYFNTENDTYVRRFKEKNPGAPLVGAAAVATAAA